MVSGLRRQLLGAAIGAALVLLGPHAWGQAPAPGGSKEKSSSTSTTSDAPPPTPSTGLTLGTYPLELMRLMAPPEARGPVTFIPTVSISGEYNDNFFANNDNRQHEWIMGITPAFLLFLNDPTFRVTAGYSFTSEFYEPDSQFNNAFARHFFVADGFYRVTPRFTLTLYDLFAYDQNANLIASQGFITGRQESWSNTVGPGITWEATPQTTFTLGASWGTVRFLGDGSGRDSDTYSTQATLAYNFTQRFTGLAGYAFTYLDLEGQDSSWTHLPSVGARYRITSSLTGFVQGGPAITTVGGETFVSPAGTIGLSQTLRYGSWNAQYTRGIGIAGAFAGTTDTQSVSGSIRLSSWIRGLILALSPVYSTAESVSSAQADRVNVSSVTVNLDVSYQFGRFVGMFAGYSYLHQRTAGSSAVQADVDQNRVRVGLQFGYPINFE